MLRDRRAAPPRRSSGRAKPPASTIAQPAQFGRPLHACPRPCAVPKPPAAQNDERRVHDKKEEEKKREIVHTADARRGAVKGKGSPSLEFDGTIGLPRLSREWPRWPSGFRLREPAQGTSVATPARLTTPDAPLRRLGRLSAALFLCGLLLRCDCATQRKAVSLNPRGDDRGPTPPSYGASFWRGPFLCGLSGEL